MRDDDRRAAWGSPEARAESRWPARLAILIAAALYATLPQRLVTGPVWLLPALEVALIIPLTLVVPMRWKVAHRHQRAAAITLIALVSVANSGSLLLLLHFLLAHPSKASGTELVFAALQIWVTNVLVFALWYWELDRGGPEARRASHHPRPDFLFPQMATPGCTAPGWSPIFIDYVFVAFTNATAFSPTDTLPLTPWAKLLMMLQSATSLLTIAFVAARAVNILS